MCAWEAVQCAGAIMKDRYGSLRVTNMSSQDISDLYSHYFPVYIHQPSTVKCPASCTGRCLRVCSGWLDHLHVFEIQSDWFGCGQVEVTEAQSCMCSDQPLANGAGRTEGTFIIYSFIIFFPQMRTSFWLVMRMPEYGKKTRTVLMLEVGNIVDSITE